MCTSQVFPGKVITDAPILAEYSKSNNVKVMDMAHAIKRQRDILYEAID